MSFFLKLLSISGFFVAANSTELIPPKNTVNSKYSTALCNNNKTVSCISPFGKKTKKYIKPDKQDCSQLPYCPLTTAIIEKDDKKIHAKTLENTPSQSIAKLNQMDEIKKTTPSHDEICKKILENASLQGVVELMPVNVIKKDTFKRVSIKDFADLIISDTDEEKSQNSYLDWWSDLLQLSKD